MPNSTVLTQGPPEVLVTRRSIRWNANATPRERINYKLAMGAKRLTFEIRQRGVNYNSETLATAPLEDSVFTTFDAILISPAAYLKLLQKDSNVVPLKLE